MNSNAFEYNMKDFNTQATYSSSPFAPANNLNKADANPSKGLFSGLSGMFSGAGKDTLPYSYTDPTHTKTTSSPSNNTSSWVPSFISNVVSSPSLATTNAANTNSWFETMGLTRTQRYSAFGLCMAAAAFLFLLAMFHLPFVVLRPGKFVVPYCMASLFILVSFGFLHGFISYSQHLVSRQKLPYSAWFIISTFLTLYTAISIKSYLLTVVMLVVQMSGMGVFIISYIPGGSSGISFMSSMIGSTIRSRFAPNSF